MTPHDDPNARASDFIELFTEIEENYKNMQKKAKSIEEQNITQDFKMLLIKKEYDELRVKFEQSQTTLKEAQATL